MSVAPRGKQTCRSLYVKADVAVNRFSRLGVPDRFVKHHQVGALPSPVEQSSRGLAAELPIIRSCSVIHRSESHIGFAGPPPYNCGDRRTSEMQYVCDAPNGKAWFRIETEGEAVHESRLMSHTVEKYFRREREKAVQSWRPERPNATSASRPM